MASKYEYVKEARAKKRKDLQELKDNKPCVRCKNTFPHYILEWHHRIKKEKLFKISNAVRNNISWEKILVEINKCDLLCSNCHAEVEYLHRYPSG